MMSYNEYKRGRQHLNVGHQRIAYKKKVSYLHYDLPKVING